MIGSSLQANGYDGQLPTSLIACIWIVEESAVICSEELRNGKDRLRSCGMEVYEARLFFSSKLTTEPRCGFLRPKTLLEGIREVIRLQDL